MRWSISTTSLGRRSSSYSWCPGSLGPNISRTLPWRCLRLVLLVICPKVERISPYLTLNPSSKTICSSRVRFAAVEVTNLVNSRSRDGIHGFFGLPTFLLLRCVPVSVLWVCGASNEVDELEFRVWQVWIDFDINWCFRSLRRSLLHFIRTSFPVVMDMTSSDECWDVPRSIIQYDGSFERYHSSFTDTIRVLCLNP